jgi:hypothetical protein
MRLDSLKLLRKFLSRKELVNKIKKIFKGLLEGLIDLTNDGTQGVRDVALSVLCKLKEIYGM